MKIDFPSETRDPCFTLPRSLSPWQLIKAQQGTVIQKRWIRSKEKTHISAGKQPCWWDWLLSCSFQCLGTKEAWWTHVPVLFCKNFRNSLKTSKKFESVTHRQSTVQGYKTHIIVPKHTLDLNANYSCSSLRALAGCQLWMHTDPQTTLSS